MKNNGSDPLASMVKDADRLLSYEEARYRILWSVVVTMLLSTVLGVGFLVFNPETRPFFLSPKGPTMPPVAMGPRWAPTAETEPPPTGQPTPQTQNPSATTAPPRLGYQPAYLKFSSRPTFPTSLDPRDQSWFEWLAAGNLEYESWQGMVRGQTIMYKHKPSLEAVICAIAVENLGGAPANDLLAILETEGNAKRTGNFPCSPAGACGPMQFMPGTWQGRKPYPNANISDLCDAMLGASNLLKANQSFAQNLSESEYDSHFRGEWKAGTAWNDHPQQAAATYRLSRLLAQSRMQFWK